MADEKKIPTYAELGARVGKLVQEKQAAYGDSFGKSGAVMAILYPDGVPPEKQDDALTVVRVIDKLFRIATQKDAFGESPWQDIVGYGLLALRKAEAGKDTSTPVGTGIEEGMDEKRHVKPLCAFPDGDYPCCEKDEEVEGAEPTCVDCGGDLCCYEERCDDCQHEYENDNDDGVEPDSEFADCQFKTDKPWEKCPKRKVA